MTNILNTLSKVTWWFILFVAFFGGWTAACGGLVVMIIAAIGLDLATLILATAVTFVGVAAGGLACKPTLKLLDS